MTMLHATAYVRLEVGDVTLISMAALKAQLLAAIGTSGHLTSVSALPDPTQDVAVQRFINQVLG
jgi:hypothetical protein